MRNHVPARNILRSFSMESILSRVVTFRFVPSALGYVRKCVQRSSHDSISSRYDFSIFRLLESYIYNLSSTQNSRSVLSFSLARNILRSLPKNWSKTELILSQVIAILRSSRSLESFVTRAVIIKKFPFPGAIISSIDSRANCHGTRNTIGNNSSDTILSNGPYYLRKILVYDSITFASSNTLETDPYCPSFRPLRLPLSPLESPSPFVFPSSREGGTHPATGGVCLRRLRNSSFLISDLFSDIMKRWREQMAGILSRIPEQGVVPWSKIPDGANTTSTTKVSRRTIITIIPICLV